ncbi:M56 family metallopeptidase [Sphingobacterium hungaricum]
MIYFILANSSLLFFYLMYVLFFKNLTFYQLNRTYLVSALIVSFLLPILQFIDLGIDRTMFVAMVELPVTDLVYDQQTESNAQSFLNSIDWIFWIYTIGCLILGIRFIGKLISLKRTFTEAEKSNSSFSFFHRIVIGSEVADSALIYKHEEVHYKQGHSVDVILVELLRIFNWFNPVFYFYLKEIKFQHECIADAICAKENKVYYAELLVANAMQVTPSTLSHHFSTNSYLKKRIMNLFKKQSNKTSQFRYAFAIPIIFVISVISLSCNDKTPESLESANNPIDSYQQSSANLSENNVVDSAQKEITFEEVEIMPVPAGGIDAFRLWIGENYKYPQAAVDAGVKGIIEVNFVVEKDGSLTDFKIIRDLGHETGKALVDLLKESRKWSPGIQNGRPVRVEYKLPVRLDLTNQ